MDQVDRPRVCGIMGFVPSSSEAKARTARANRIYSRLRDQLAEAREELAASIIAERKEGEKIEDIAGRVVWRQTQVNRVLEAAGLTEKRSPRDS